MKMFSSEDRTIELHLVMGAVSVFVFLGLSAYTVIAQAQHFDPQTFGIGLGAVFTATGVAGVLQGSQRRIENGTATTDAAPTTQGQ